MPEATSITAESLTPNQLVNWFLMASYLYYQKDVSVLTDAQFDGICQRLLKEYDGITHPHKWIITKEDLEAGSGFAIPALRYPRGIVRAALTWARVEGKL